MKVFKFLSILLVSSLAVATFSSLYAADLAAAERLYFEGKFKEAAKEYDEVFYEKKYTPQNIEKLLFRYGTSYFLSGDLSLAKGVFTLAKKLDPNFFDGKIGYVPSEGMSSTIIKGDQLFIDTYFYDDWQIRSGDVIAFNHPIDSKERIFVRRVVALPGDSIKIIDKKLYVNGVEVSEKFVTHKDDKLFTEGDGTIRDQLEEFVVPASSYFVMGDNRDFSFDSRFFGPVKKKVIVGKAIAIYASLPDKNSMEGNRTERVGMIIR